MTDIEARLILIRLLELNRALKEARESGENFGTAYRDYRKAFNEAKDAMTGDSK